ncbi:MAG TPA: hypothetical protein VD887_01070 [Allosphingosinicella sp.]|nr:hypothetical protein [Allosphingosinicella sp.]
MKRAILFAGAAALAGLAAPAAAQQADFRACDGFRAPGRDADGMQRRARPIFSTMLPVLGTTIPRELTREAGAAGIKACDDALASPLLLPAYALRRASLLRARGLYRLAAREDQAALADFAASDEAAAAANDLYYRRSLGLGTALLRAYAHHLGGRRDDAVAGARAVLEARPTDPESGSAAADLILAATGDWDVYTQTVRGVARYDPGLLVPLYIVSTLRGRFEEALALQPQIVFGVPSTRGGSLVGGRGSLIANNFMTQLDIDGSGAFARAALGRRAEAEAEIAALAERVEAALRAPTPPAPEADQREYRRANDRYRQIEPRAEEARGRLAFWRRLVELRAMIDSGRAAEAAEQLTERPLGNSIYGLTIYEALARARPEARAMVEPRIEAARTAVQAQLARIAELGLSSLGRRLPESEDARRLPGYNGGSDGFLGGDGFMSRRAVLEGARTVKFQSDDGTAATNAEMALLRAAELAQEQNKGGFIVLDRRVLQRTLVTRQYGAVIDTDHEGFVAELDVVFADANALPAGFEQSGWRFVDAADVIARLGPVYRRPADASRRRRT